MTPPLVSILVAAYNAALYIQETITSVKEQTYENWEMVIVDDGSTDDTTKIIQEAALEDQRVHLITQSNLGAQVARNTAYARAKGDFIIILDADDTILPEKVSLQVRRFERLSDKVGVVYGDTWHCDERMAKISLESAKFPGQHVSGDVYESIICGNLFAVHSAMIRRICLEDVGLHDENPYLIADWDLWVRIAARYQFVYHDDPVANYRFHPHMSARSDVATKQLCQRVGVANKIRNMRRFKKVSRGNRSRFEFANGRFAQKFGLHCSAIKFFIMSIKVHPLYVKPYIALLSCFLLHLKGKIG